MIETRWHWENTHFSLFITFSFGESPLDIMSHSFENESLHKCLQYMFLMKLMRVPIVCKKPGHVSTATSKNVMKNTQWLRPKLILLIYWIKGLDMQRNVPLELLWNRSWNPSMCMLVHIQPQSLRASKMVWHGITGNRSTWGAGEGKAGGRVKSNPEESLNPVEFLSSSAAPLGGVRSLWRERGKTGTVRNKASNSHDMFS